MKRHCHKQSGKHNAKQQTTLKSSIPSLAASVCCLAVALAAPSALSQRWGAEAAEHSPSLSPSPSISTIDAAAKRYAEAMNVHLSRGDDHANEEALASARKQKRRKKKEAQQTTDSAGSEDEAAGTENRCDKDVPASDSAPAADAPAAVVVASPTSPPTPPEEGAAASAPPTANATAAAPAAVKESPSGAPPESQGADAAAPAATPSLTSPTTVPSSPTTTQEGEAAGDNQASSQQPPKVTAPPKKVMPFPLPNEFDLPAPLEGVPKKLIGYKAEATPLPPVLVENLEDYRLSQKGFIYRPRTLFTHTHPSRSPFLRLDHILERYYSPVKNSEGRELATMSRSSFTRPNGEVQHARRGATGHRAHMGYSLVTIPISGDLRCNDVCRVSASDDAAWRLGFDGGAEGDGSGGGLGGLPAGCRADMTANASLIRAGGAHWLRGGGKTVWHESRHSNGFVRRGGFGEAIELWVDIPSAFKGEECPPNGWDPAEEGSEEAAVGKVSSGKEVSANTEAEEEKEEDEEDAGGDDDDGSGGNEKRRLRGAMRRPRDGACGHRHFTFSNTSVPVVPLYAVNAKKDWLAQRRREAEARAARSRGRPRGLSPAMEAKQRREAEEEAAAAAEAAAVTYTAPVIGSARLFAGTLNGATGPANRSATFVPMNVWEILLAAPKETTTGISPAPLSPSPLKFGAAFPSVDLPQPEGWTTLVVVLSGQVEVSGGVPQLKKPSPDEDADEALDNDLQYAEEGADVDESSSSRQSQTPSKGVRIGPGGVAHFSASGTALRLTAVLQTPAQRKEERKRAGVLRLAKMEVAVASGRDAMVAEVMDRVLAEDELTHDTSVWDPKQYRLLVLSAPSTLAEGEGVFAEGPAVMPTAKALAKALARHKRELLSGHERPQGNMAMAEGRQFGDVSVAKNPTEDG